MSVFIIAPSPGRCATIKVEEHIKTLEKQMLQLLELSQKSLERIEALEKKNLTYRKNCSM